VAHSYISLDVTFDGLFSEKSAFLHFFMVNCPMMILLLFALWWNAYQHACPSASVVTMLLIDKTPLPSS
jgi:hypothetical protein